MDDLISRKDAIDAVRKKIADYIPLLHGWLNGLPIGIEMGIRQVPSARKQGKWVVVTRHEHYPSGKPHEQLRCPFCKRFDHNGDGNFCGYCGADMRGEDGG